MLGNYLHRENLGFKDKIFALDYILVFLVLLLGIISIFGGMGPLIGITIGVAIGITIGIAMGIYGDQGSNPSGWTSTTTGT